MKEIELSKGKVVLVDDEDYDFLMQWSWHAYQGGSAFYAKRYDKQPNNKLKAILMHRVIMHTPIGMQVDHIDHDGLNNQKYNMRNCTCTQNMYNRLPRGKSKCMGVSISKKGAIQMQIEKKGVIQIHKNYKTEIEAALAYDVKAKELFGEYANLNFK